MFKASSKITINQGMIKRLSQAQITALEKTAGDLHTEISQAQVVPRDTGALQGEKMFIDCSESARGKVSIIHEGPYARRLYFHPEYNFRKEENPNARGKWFEPWLPGGLYEDLAKKAFAKSYKREAGL